MQGLSPKHIGITCSTKWFVPPASRIESVLKFSRQRWLQTDFRQEKRWKMVTAHNLARAVQSWHRASPNERLVLCVKCSPPSLLPIDFDSEEEAVPARLATSMTTRLGSKESQPAVPGEEGRSSEMDIDAEGEADVEGEEDTEGEVDVEGASASVSGDVTVKIGLEGSLAVSDEPPSSSSAPKTDSPQPLPDPHSLALLRAPIFELDARATIIDAAALDDNGAEFALSMDLLFPDLPLYSIPTPDAAHDKRIEEASAFSGRITNVSKHFDSRPLLVSTLQPSKTRSPAGWNAAMSYNLEDVKEFGDNLELSPVASRKSSPQLPPLCCL